MRGTSELFCPHCDVVIEILGEVPRAELQCDTPGCGGILERFEGDERFELTAQGLAALEAAIGAPARPPVREPSRRAS